MEVVLGSSSLLPGCAEGEIEAVVKNVSGRRPGGPSRAQWSGWGVVVSGVTTVPDTDLMAGGRTLGGAMFTGAVLGVRSVRLGDGTTPRTVDDPVGRAPRYRTHTLAAKRRAPLFVLAARAGAELIGLHHKENG